MRTDMLDRLRADPGTRTFGELAQERQWALQEIHRLRTLLGHEGASRARYAKTSERHSGEEAADPDAVAALPSQFMTMAEVTKHVGFSRATIYKLLRDGRFPKPARMGVRSLRWRVEDLMAWGNSLGG